MHYPLLESDCTWSLLGLIKGGKGRQRRGAGTVRKEAVVVEESGTEMLENDRREMPWVANRKIVTQA